MCKFTEHRVMITQFFCIRKFVKHCFIIFLFCFQFFNRKIQLYNIYFIKSFIFPFSRPGGFILFITSHFTNVREKNCFYQQWKFHSTPYGKLRKDDATFEGRLVCPTDLWIRHLTFQPLKKLRCGLFHQKYFVS